MTTDRTCPVIRRRLRRGAGMAAALTLSAGLLATAARGGSVPGEGTPSHTDPITVTTTVTDPAETSGRLDITQVRHRIVGDRREARVSYRVRTSEPFSARRLHPRWRSFVIELNRDGERGSERNVRVSARGGVLVAEVISNATRDTITTVPVTRLDARTLGISAPREVIGARSYFWVSNFHARSSPECGRGDGFPILCQDVAPDDGWLRLDRWGWPSPTEAE